MGQTPKTVDECAESVATHLKELRNAVAELDTSISDAELLTHQERIPHSGEPGVYLIFGEDDRLLYVGKAERDLGYEVWSKFLPAKTGPEVQWIYDEWQNTPPHRIATIPIQKEIMYLAPALEGLLIRRLDPLLNTHGKSAE